jgi:hypothetical protein
MLADAKTFSLPSCLLLALVLIVAPLAAHAFDGDTGAASGSRSSGILPTVAGLGTGQAGDESNFAPAPDLHGAPGADAAVREAKVPEPLADPDRRGSSSGDTPELRASVPSAAIKVPCPRIPDATDLNLTDEEWAKVQRGEIIVQFVSYSPEERQVRAIGYLDADPIWLFDLATDSHLAPDLVDAVKTVAVLEQRPDGKLIRGQAKPAFFLPTYRYTLASHYRADHTGQCWGQVEGDFDRNEGAHSFIWDPERKQTLAVFSFYFKLSGVLKLVPESWILHKAGSTLPDFMRKLAALVPKYAHADTPRARHNAEAWASLRARLEHGDLPGRVWYGPPRIEQADARAVR